MSDIGSNQDTLTAVIMVDTVHHTLTITRSAIPKFCLAAINIEDLLNLLNKLRKSDKMRGLSSILSLFHNDFNKFNNTRGGMLDSIYHVTLKQLSNRVFASKT